MEDAYAGIAPAESEAPPAYGSIISPDLQLPPYRINPTFGDKIRKQLAVAIEKVRSLEEEALQNLFDAESFSRDTQTVTAMPRSHNRIIEGDYDIYPTSTYKILDILRNHNSNIEDRKNAIEQFLAAHRDLSFKINEALKNSKLKIGTIKWRTPGKKETILEDMRNLADIEKEIHSLKRRVLDSLTLSREHYVKLAEDDFYDFKRALQKTKNESEELLPSIIVTILQSYDNDSLPSDLREEIKNALNKFNEDYLFVSQKSEAYEGSIPLSHYISKQAFLKKPIFVDYYDENGERISLPSCDEF